MEWRLQAMEQPFAGYISSFSWNTETRLKSSDEVFYHVVVVFLHFSERSTDSLCNSKDGQGDSTKCLSSIKLEMLAVSITSHWTISGPLQLIIYAQNAYLQDHIVVVLQNFGALTTIEASPFGHYNVHVEQSYSPASPRTGTSLNYC